jgi:uncharacterized protein YdhG (YjbR/CyaY superfamily)
MKSTKKPAKGKTGKSSTLFSAEEKAAMRELVKERKAAETGREAEAAVVAAIAKMKEPDRGLAKRIHALVKSSAPSLSAKTWYGMPAYAKDGKVVCFFRDAGKFGTRYATLGFEDAANLDDGALWPVAFALKELTPAVETKIGALVKKAAS